MSSFLKPAALLKMNSYWGIFQGFCLKVSEEFIYRTPPRIFVVIVLLIIIVLVLVVIVLLINSSSNKY